MKLLFMCVANSARSQMAEGLAKQLFSDLPSIEIASAGSQPTVVNPLAQEVMREIGISLDSQFSKSVDDLPSDFCEKLNFVITLCAEEVCPAIITNAKRLHWPLPDPAGKDELPIEQQLNEFRQTRDALRVQVQAFRSKIIEEAKGFAPAGPATQ